MKVEMKGIFINYRREDSIAIAGRIYDRVSAHFGRDRVFMDIDTISPGDDFVEAIERTCESCGVLLALIGKSWSTVTDKRGKRRLDNPADFVRLEIAKAFTSNVRVIPVLLDDAEMPDPEALPADLCKLATRHASQVSSLRFHQDIDRLIAAVEKTLTASATLNAAVRPREEEQHLTEGKQVDTIREQHHAKEEEDKKKNNNEPLRQRKNHSEVRSTESKLAKTRDATGPLTVKDQRVAEVADLLGISPEAKDPRRMLVFYLALLASNLPFYVRIGNVRSLWVVDYAIFVFCMVAGFRSTSRKLLRAFAVAAAYALFTVALWGGWGSRPSILTLISLVQQFLSAFVFLALLIFALRRTARDELGGGWREQKFVWIAILVSSLVFNPLIDFTERVCRIYADPRFHYFLSPPSAIFYVISAISFITVLGTGLRFLRRRSGIALRS